MMRIANLFICLCLVVISYSQETTNVLRLEEYLSIVRESHPIMTRASLLQEQGQALLMESRGAFDPKLEADLDRKNFENKEYYNRLSSKLKIPTRFAADFGVGYERNNGEFLDSSELLPARGLWSAGVEIPLIRGLVNDERRTQLKQAELLNQMLEQDRIQLVNELLIDASSVYLEWQYDYAYIQIQEEALNISLELFDAVKSSFLNGDKAAVDTLEAAIQVQNRRVNLSKAVQYVQDSKINLENYLWSVNGIPLELQEQIIPENIDLNWQEQSILEMRIRLNELALNNPEIVTMGLEVQDLDLEQKLSREMLKPDLRLGAYLLSGADEQTVVNPIQLDNYKIKASFNYPLFLRKERAKVKLNQLKLSDTKLKLKNKEQLVRQKLYAYLNNHDQLIDQTEQYVLLVSNYSDLFSTERIKFDLGESSLFLLNSRQNKLLENQEKYLKSQYDLLYYRLLFLYQTGKLEEIL